MHDWVKRRWGATATARVVEREPLAGGYTSPAVERLELRISTDDGPRRCLVVRKRATAAEVVAMRVLREVSNAPALPELLDSGDDQAGPWIVTPFYAGDLARSEAEVSVDALESLAFARAFQRRARGRAARGRYRVVACRVPARTATPGRGSSVSADQGSPRPRRRVRS